MIRYSTSEAKLIQLIRAEKAGWLERAEKRTERFKQQGRFNDSSPIWSEIKDVYMTIQHNKCAYCERKLEGTEYGKIEHDIEHFRPKNAVKKWPTRKIRKQRGVAHDFGLGTTWSEGYYLLAYHPLNYLTACKTCNSTLKSNYFPVAAARVSAAEHPNDLVSEEAYLLYPISDIDDDPQDVITFLGLLPVPKASPNEPADQRRFRRALITIDIFELDTREELLRNRAEQIRTLAFALRILKAPRNNEEARDMQRTIDNLRKPNNPHCNCVNAFYDLYHSDRAQADAFYDDIMAYLNSQS